VAAYLRWVLGKIYENWKKNYIIIYECDFLHAWPVRQPKISLVVLSHKILDTHEITRFVLVFRLTTFAGTFPRQCTTDIFKTPQDVRFNCSYIYIYIYIYVCVYVCVCVCVCVCVYNTVLQRVNSDQKIGILTCKDGILGQWKIKTNAELITKYKSQDIVTVIKIRRLEWLGHVIRVNETRSVKKVLEGKLEGRRGRGRPRLRWINDVEEDLRKLGVKRFRKKALDREE